MRTQSLFCIGVVGIDFVFFEGKSYILVCQLIDLSTLALANVVNFLASIGRTNWCSREYKVRQQPNFFAHRSDAILCSTTTSLSHQSVYELI